LLVTGVSLGLADEERVGTEEVDYRIVPEGGANSAVTAVEAPQLGGVHPVAERLRARPDVAYATPVLVEYVRVPVDSGNADTGDDSAVESVLMIGVVPDADRQLVGLSTAGLTPGDPYYANGSYDGSRTGETVISTSAAETLGVGRGDSISPAGTDRSFRTVAVRRPTAVGLGQLPVAIVHLSELQAVSGATASDSANQLLVDASGDPDGLKQDLAGVYPRTEVLERGAVFGSGSRSELSTAMGVSALLVSVAIGTLFVVTTMGFEVASQARTRAVLAAMGVSRRSRAVLVALGALAVAVAGGIVGVVLWLLGTVGLNAAGRFVLGVPVARLHPVLAVYGLAVAVLVGLLAIPYLLVVSRRTTSLEVLDA